MLTLFLTANLIQTLFVFECYYVVRWRFAKQMHQLDVGQVGLKRIHDNTMIRFIKMCSFYHTASMHGGKSINIQIGRVHRSVDDSTEIIICFSASPRQRPPPPPFHCSFTWWRRIGLDYKELPQNQHSIPYRHQTWAQCVHEECCR
jgi:hypothetical protein